MKNIMNISEERNDVLPLQWSVNNWQKWKEVQTHVRNSISCFCFYHNSLQRKMTNGCLDHLEGTRLEKKKNQKILNKNQLK